MSYERKDIGPCTLYRGDCIELLSAGVLSGADAVVSDPPYGVAFKRGGGKMSELCNDVMVHDDDKPFDPKPWIDAFYQNKGGVQGKAPVLFMGANHFASRLPDGAWFAWDKSCGYGPPDSFPDAEFGWCSRKNPRNLHRQLWKGLLRSGEGNTTKHRRPHPSQKPVELMLYCLEYARIKIGATVLDPYMGTATTGIACLRTGRRFIGVEIDEGYFKIACDRIQAEWDRITMDLLHDPADYAADAVEAA